MDGPAKPGWSLTNTVFSDLFGKAGITLATVLIGGYVAYQARDWYNALTTGSWILSTTWMTIGWIVFYALLIWAWYKANTIAPRQAMMSNAMYFVTLILLLSGFVTLFAVKSPSTARWLFLLAALVMLWQTVKVFGTNAGLGWASLVLTLWLAYQTAVVFKLAAANPASTNA